ncbi:uncharacterized protein GLRG_11963 [Colletotrichum graminicola M1.001]|uniref:Methyltransferase domain-containing protein n=1 Tax=Colletotrichum graminicola (strain M1.001 / M2 / FGSC 10212) TaxID=645133 RepID=E3R129_COLGM|nr:uncharacterized protein GLRG_11963 [Colletotrichum graminicola M1.001]EFQ36817.1 hypothetical protein GLRG_11963 [Colletotrichum graminicola M1.001]
MLFTQALGADLFLFNNPRIRRILEFGTATGILAIDAADRKGDEATIVSVDPCQAHPESYPSNIVFCQAQADVLRGFSPNHFDVVRISDRPGLQFDTNRLYAEAYSLLRPRGQVEVIHLEIAPGFTGRSPPDDSKLAYWCYRFQLALEELGAPQLLVGDTANQLRAAGFIQVTTEKIRLPTCWPPDDTETYELGRWLNLFLRRFVESMTPLVFGQLLGWERERFASLVDEVSIEMSTLTVGAYMDLYFWKGIKGPTGPM